MPAPWKMPKKKKQFEFEAMWSWYVEIRARFLRDGRLDANDRRDLSFVLTWAREEGLQSIQPIIEQILKDTAPKPSLSGGHSTSIVVSGHHGSSVQSPQVRLQLVRQPTLFSSACCIMKILNARGSGTHELCYMSMLEEFPDLLHPNNPWVKIYIAQVDASPIVGDNDKLQYKFFGISNGAVYLAAGGTKVDQGVVSSDRRGNSSIFVNFGRPVRALRFYEDKLYTQQNLPWKISSAKVRRSLLLEFMLGSEHEHQKNKTGGALLNVDFDQAPNQFAITNQQALLIQQQMQPNSFVDQEDPWSIRNLFGMSQPYAELRFEHPRNGHPLEVGLDKTTYRFLSEFYQVKLSTLHAKILGLAKLLATAEDRMDRHQIVKRTLCHCRILLASFGYTAIRVDSEEDLRRLYDQVGIHLSYYGLNQCMPAIYDPKGYQERQEKALKFESKNKPRVEARSAYLGLVDACAQLAEESIIAFDRANANAKLVCNKIVQMSLLNYFMLLKGAGRTVPKQ